jgi:hypothetical protein
MKKLLMSLLSFSLVSSVSAEVIACNSSADLYSTISFGEKISSLKNLDGNLLRKNGVMASSFYADDVLQGFIDAVKVGIYGNNDPVTSEKDDPDNNSKDELFEQLENNARGIFFANDFLYQVGKIPGYHWITERLRIQSSQFDLFYKGDELGKSWNIKDSMDIFARFISSWMSRDNWGISVTFFDNNKDPWHGNGNPAFARINVNQRVIVEKGKINLEESMPNAVHDGPVFPGLDDQGYIYQGYVFGSDLINISECVSDRENESAQIDLLSYTPSAFDIVNNIMASATVDDIIKNFSKNFMDDVDNMLTKDPIYLGDETKNKSVVARFQNISFNTLFKVVLTRREMAAEGWKNIYAQLENLKDDTAKLAVITSVSNKLWGDIAKFIGLDNVINFSSKDYSNDQVKSDIQLLSNWMAKDVRDNDLENKEIENHIDELSAALMRLINNTRTSFDDEEQYNICVSKTINVLPFFFKGNDYNSIDRVDKADLTEFGNNDDYNFADLIFGRSGDISKISDPSWIQEHMKQLYNPDLTTSKAKMADRGFKNVSVRKRVSGSNSILSEYNTLFNTSYRQWMITYGADSTVATSPLSPGVAKNMSEGKYGNDVANPTKTDWFNEGFEIFLKQNGIEDHGEQINLQMLGQNYDSNIRALIQKYFTFDDNTKSMLIWNINNQGDLGLSSDRKLDGPGQNHVQVKYDSSKPYDFDDDIAFSDVAGMHSKINYGKNPMYATEWTDFNNGRSISNFRNRVVENGYNDLPYEQHGINPIEFKIAIGSVNSYGETTSDPFGYSAFMKNNSLIDGATSYVSFVQTDLRDDGSKGQPYADAVRKFWEYWVWKNPDKEGQGYNPNAGERPNYDE